MNFMSETVFNKDIIAQCELPCSNTAITKVLHVCHLLQESLGNTAA